METPDTEDTICAIATPVGQGGIGIIKISGPSSLAIARAVFLPQSPRHIPSHCLSHGWIRDPSTGDTVDEVLLSYMSAPHTHTREDVVEINCHSGYASLDRILNLVLSAGARLAEPGEFTRRAFLNGRIDLTQAEAVIDIIHARSEQGLLLANRNLGGNLSRIIEEWEHTLLHIQAQLEAEIDFSDDVEDEMPASPSVYSILESKVIAPMQQALLHFDSARIIREGLTLVLVGKPNVGKSSLLNVLLGKDRAIVTANPGTTRDVIEDSFVLSGILVRILDTAGIRDEPDEVETIGIARTLRSVSEADGVLWLIDQSRPLSPEDHMVFEAVRSASFVILLNKMDLPSAVSIEDVRDHFGSEAAICELSVFNPLYIEDLRKVLIKLFLRHPLEKSQSMIVTTLRQKEHLRLALESVKQAQIHLLNEAYSDLACFEFRSARKHLGALLGTDGDDKLLDQVFSQFCVGK